MSKHVICIGEALIDFVCTDVGDDNADKKVFLRKPGGAPANVAACIGRLGGRAEFFGAVGSDGFGDYLVNTLQHFNVGISGVQRVSEPTTLAFVTLQDDGEREFIFNRGADAQFVAPYEDGDFHIKKAIFHFGSATAFLDGSLHDAYGVLARQCRKNQNIVSFDPNYRVDLWGARLDVFKAKCHAFFKLADIVKVSEEELQLLTGEQDIVLGCEQIHAHGVKIIFVTRGCNGVYLSTTESARTLPAYRINAIDTTGAGDAFIGAMLYKLSLVESLDSMSFKTLSEAVIFAQKVSAYVCEHIGAMTALPTEFDVSKRAFEDIIG